MGAETSSCHGCKCDDKCTTPNGTPTKVTRYEFEEEICNPEEKCNSWTADPTKSIPLLEQKSAIDLPPLVKRTKSSRGRKGIDDEKRLHFSFSYGDHAGLELQETTNEVAGLTLASLLVVVHVEPESAFVRTKDGQHGVCAGDVIVEVNGRRGTAKQIRQILEEEINYAACKGIKLIVRPRPPTFYVEIPCDDDSGKKLGMVAVVDKSNPDCVLVQALRSEGLVPDWNASHGSLQVCAGDLIIEVNGISGDAAAMCRAMQDLRIGSMVCFRIMTLRSHAAGQSSNACQSEPMDAEFAYGGDDQANQENLPPPNYAMTPSKRKKTKRKVKREIVSDSEDEMEISVFLGTPSKREM